MRLLIFYHRYPLSGNNHAGMVHFAHALKQNLPFEVILFEGIPTFKKTFFGKQKNNKVQFFNEIINTIQSDDKILFLEYMGTHEAMYQVELLTEIRMKGFKNKVYSLIHLPFRNYIEYFSPNYIDDALRNTDKIIVYGSSLKKDIEYWGFGDKVLDTFHFVDNDFFCDKSLRDFNSRLKVIIWGNTFRNITYLRKIVSECPEMDFIFCIGKKPYKGLLPFPNVQVFEYVEEDKLLNLLQNAHVNLSVMYDTIGSNVIVISKSCGLVNVVSNVGSIKNYCTTEDSFICDEVGSFISALKGLETNRLLLETMSKKSKHSSENFSLSKSLLWFQNLVLN